MLNEQQIFDKACNFLRTKGNPYGSRLSRGWGSINPNNTNERCAIASFISGETEREFWANLKLTTCYRSPTDNTGHSVVWAIINLFDYDANVCNNRALLEDTLKKIADKNKLQYKNNKEQRLEILEELTKEAQELEMGY